MASINQRAKIDDIRLNDENSRYFYAKFVERKSFNRITSTKDMNGVSHLGHTQVNNALVQHYEKLLGVGRDSLPF